MTDLVTGLVWAKQTVGPGVSVAEATNQCSTLSAQNYGSRSNWRLPTVRELMSIVDHGRMPAVNPVFAPTASGLFWTNSPHDATTTHGVNFNLGAVFWYRNGGVGSTHARCLSGVTGATLTTTTCTPGTVIDQGTWLEWQLQASNSTFTWGQALNHCSGLGNGWRAPNAKELLTLFLPARTPAYQSVFAGEPGVPFWSSTPVRGSSNGAFVVDFGPSRTVLEGVERGATRAAASRALRAQPLIPAAVTARPRR